MVPCQYIMALHQDSDGGTASNIEGSFEYIENTVADSRQGVVFQLRGGWARCQQLLPVKTYLVTKCSYRKPRTWTDSLVRPQRWGRGPSSIVGTATR
jgi:hypothetical protein